jgi:hypothetical protein
MGGAPAALAKARSPGARGDGLLAWLKPANFSRPEVFFHDLFGLGLKNDSAMNNYNLYSTGRGGACGLWTNAWGPETSYGWDYHCGNVTDGGWEEVDELMQSIGQLNMPNGLLFDATQLPNVAAWKLNLDPAQRTNGAAIVNVWMTQGWFNNMLYVTGQTAVNASAGVLNMVADDGHYPSGGWQGGRHWQTRCSFDGCGPGGDLLGGGWFVTNVAQELDSFDEYFFDPATSTLTVFYNASATLNGTAAAPPPAGLVLMAPQLEVFFNFSAGATDITIDGLGFRDQRFSYMDPWVVPSKCRTTTQPALFPLPAHPRLTPDAFPPCPDSFSCSSSQRRRGLGPPPRRRRQLRRHGALHAFERALLAHGRERRLHRRAQPQCERARLRVRLARNERGREPRPVGAGRRDRRRAALGHAAVRARRARDRAVREAVLGLLCRAHAAEPPRGVTLLQWTSCHGQRE